MQTGVRTTAEAAPCIEGLLVSAVTGRGSSCLPGGSFLGTADSNVGYCAW